MKKICAHCGSEFEKEARRQKYCRPCAPEVERQKALERYRRNRDTDPEAIRQRQREWKAANPERVRQHTRKALARMGMRPIGEPTPCRDCGCDFVLEKPRQVRCEPCQTVATERRIKINRENAKIRARERMAVCPVRRLNRRIKFAIWSSLKKKKGGRAWCSLVGYDVEELRRHLERQFLPGMTWGNMGRWEIDHITPLSSFSFDGPDDPEFKAAWAITNLRPLWARDNRSKKAKRLFLI